MTSQSPMDAPYSQVILTGAGGQLGSYLRDHQRADPLASLGSWTCVRFQELPLTVEEMKKKRSDWVAHPDRSVTWVFCHGLTDPSAPWEALEEANFLSLKRAVEASPQDPGTGQRIDRFLSVGTFLENFEGIFLNNNYVKSKRLWTRWLQESPPTGWNADQQVHLQLHTLYSPRGFRSQHRMFFAQMMDAMIEDRPFLMSTGEQLREYHHASDVARGVLEVLRDPDWNGLARRWYDAGEPVVNRVFTYSHARVLTLGEIAEGVMSHFGKSHLLKRGALGKAPFENFTRHSRRVSSPYLVERAPLEGLIQVAEGLLKGHSLRA